MRLLLSDYERACFRALGQIVSHALEATGRSINPGEQEREVAGQLCHRLIHRGAVPMTTHRRRRRSLAHLSTGLVHLHADS